MEDILSDWRNQVLSVYQSSEGKESDLSYWFNNPDNFYFFGVVESLVEKLMVKHFDNDLINLKSFKRDGCLEIHVFLGDEDGCRMIINPFSKDFYINIVSFDSDFWSNKIKNKDLMYDKLLSDISFLEKLESTPRIFRNLISGSSEISIRYDGLSSTSLERYSKDLMDYKLNFEGYYDLYNKRFNDCLYRENLIRDIKFFLLELSYEEI